jgi:hypothetical protein
MIGQGVGLNDEVAENGKKIGRRSDLVGLPKPSEIRFFGHWRKGTHRNGQGFEGIVLAGQSFAIRG